MDNIASGALELLQMVSEPDTGLCANEDIGLSRGWIVRSHLERGKEAFLIRVWKPLPSKCVLNRETDDDT